MSQQPEPGTPEAIQRRIRHARDQVLGGRGAGASPLETARWMSERPTLGGKDPAAAREAVAERAAATRGDPDALVRLTARHRARLAASVQGIADQVSRAIRRARLAAPAALAVTVLVLALLEAGKRHGDRGTGQSNLCRITIHLLPASAGRLQPAPIISSGRAAPAAALLPKGVAKRHAR